MTENREVWCQWKRDFILAWRVEMEAPEEFWSMMQDLTPTQLRVIREVYRNAEVTAYAAGAGHDFRR